MVRRHRNYFVGRDVMVGMVGVCAVLDGLPAKTLAVLCRLVSGKDCEASVDDDVKQLETRDEAGAEKQRQQSAHVTCTRDPVSQ